MGYLETALPLRNMNGISWNCPYSLSSQTLVCEVWFFLLGSTHPNIQSGGTPQAILPQLGTYHCSPLRDPECGLKPNFLSSPSWGIILTQERFSLLNYHHQSPSKTLNPLSKGKQSPLERTGLSHRGAAAPVVFHRARSLTSTIKTNSQFRR